MIPLPVSPLEPSTTTGRLVTNDGVDETAVTDNEAETASAATATLPTFDDESIIVETAFICLEGEFV